MFQCSSNCGKEQFFTTSNWQIAFENMAVRSLYGLPAPYLRYDSTCHFRSWGKEKADIEITSRLSRVAIVGYVEAIMDSHITKRKVSVHKRHLQFNNDDFSFICENLAKSESKDSPVTWCLTCPMPGFMMTMELLPMCKHKKCPTMLRTWKFNKQYNRTDPKSYMLAMRTFLTKLQSQLPRNNFANVFPIIPTTFISHDLGTSGDTTSTNDAEKEKSKVDTVDLVDKDKAPASALSIYIEDQDAKGLEPDADAIDIDQVCD